MLCGSSSALHVAVVLQLSGLILNFSAKSGKKILYLVFNLAT